MPHWSPLEMVNACLEIETTRDIAHSKLCVIQFCFPRIFFNVMQSLEEMGEQFVTREARLQDEKNRQNSIESI